MKIGFLSASDFVLLNYWNELNRLMDCTWVVTLPESYESLQKKGIHPIELVNEYDLISYLKDRFLPLKSQLFGSNTPASLIENRSKTHLLMDFFSWNKHKKLGKKADQISPDVWITGTFGRLDELQKDGVWIQTFHSVHPNEFLLHPEVMKYDLLMLPGEYHRTMLSHKFGLDSNDPRFHVVGWPRIDSLFHEGIYDRQSILESMGLNPDWKTVLYAPTNDWYGRHHLFARWFGQDYQIFDKLCKFLASYPANFIVKLHESMHKQIGDRRLLSIAKAYNVFWITSEKAAYTVDPNPYLWASDLLLSDLSGIIFEFMALDRPIVYILPDDSIELTEPNILTLNELDAGYKVRTLQQLFEAIGEALQKPELFAGRRREVLSKIFFRLDGRASQRAADTILHFLQGKLS